MIQRMKAILTRAYKVKIQKKKRTINQVKLFTCQMQNIVVPNNDLNVIHINDLYTYTMRY